MFVETLVSLVLHIPWIFLHIIELLMLWLSSRNNLHLSFSQNDTFHGGIVLTFIVDPNEWIPCSLLPSIFEKNKSHSLKKHYFLVILYCVVRELATILGWNCFAFCHSIPEQCYCILSLIWNLWQEHFWIS